mgnify:FL=1
MKRIIFVFSLLLVVLFLCVSCGKISYEWVKYRTDQDGNVYFYKMGDVRKDGPVHFVQVWGKEVYSQKGRENEIQSRAKDGLSNAGYDKLSYKKCLYDIDCNKQKISILSISHYNTEDQELYAGGSHVSKWFDIEPNSTGDHLQKEVCK